MSPSKQSVTKAKQIIDAQDVPLSIKRSAWFLFQHELSRQPRIKPRRALSNTLKWLRHQKARYAEPLRQLSPMQRKILQMLVEEGLIQKQMIVELGIGRQTVYHHYAKIMKKLGVESMYQAVAIAVEHGWVNPPKVKTRAKED